MSDDQEQDYDIGYERYLLSIAKDLLSPNVLCARGEVALGDEGKALMDDGFFLVAGILMKSFKSEEDAAAYKMKSNAPLRWIQPGRKAGIYKRSELDDTIRQAVSEAFAKAGEA